MSYALVSFLHPWSESKGERLQTLLASARSYYLSPESLCSTWTFFTPSSRPKAPFQQLSSQSPATTTTGGTPLLIGGVEIYESRQGLERQMDKPWFRDFQEATKMESLYGRAEELVAWQVVGGFVAREAREVDGKGVVVMLARFECKDGGKAKDQVVAALSRFADWVKENETATYTYCVMVRQTKKASTEVMMYERYRDTAAIKEHGGRKEFKAMFKEILPHIQTKQTRMAEWEELDFSFVGSGKSQGTKAELPAKL